MDKLTRRSFLKYAALGAVGLTGCAVDPVTGRKQWVMVSRDQELAMDRRYSPFQFSADYGVTRDKALNDYIRGVGQ
ncbi:MAG: twin-arginine translocation signal domain-containing protein, partial [Desulfovibrionales bacterium]|nr:twin-arginine translocation signal domain-containing protein [Desulfovibrionales bacterium]